MASTYSNLKIQLMATGENSGTWGSVTNVNLGTALEEAIVGSEDVTFSSGTVTLTLSNTNASQTARNLRLNLIGTSGGAQNLIVPAIEKVYIINNGCADTITVKNTTGSGVAVPAGKSMWVYNTGSDVVQVITHTPVSSGGTGASTLTANNVILGNGTSAVQFVAPGSAGNVLTSNGTTWTSGAASTGTVTSVSGTGTASGLTLSGTVTTSGSLTLSGTVNSLAAGTYGINITGTVNSLSLSRGTGSNTTNSVAIGAGALEDNTTGFRNVAVGGGALIDNTTGIYNTAVGAQALQINTTGGYNTAVGDSALYYNTTGFFNTAVGLSALVSNSTGQQNVAVGSQALDSNTIGDSNTAIGYNALDTTTTGSNNIGIGTQANASSSTVSNTITLGNSSITTLRCQVTTITALSDARDKTNVVDIPAGLSFVDALRPVSFEWNMRDGGKVGVPEFGFIAQELQAVQAETGITVPNLVYDDNPDKLEASAGTLIPVLVKAIQELNAKVEAQAIEINLLKERS